MNAARTPQDLASVERTMRIIWAAMLVSILMLVLVVHLARPEAGARPVDLAAPLLGVAALIAVASVVARRQLDTDASLRALAERAQVAPSREAGVLGLVQTRWIVFLALHEAVALLGFVTAFLSQDPARIWPFALVALALDLSIFPRPAHVLERARALTPHLGAWLLALALLPACSFRGGDFTPLEKEPDTPCSLAAEEFCKENLGSADIVTCVKREKYRCELLEQEQGGKGEQPAPP